MATQRLLPLIVRLPLALDMVPPISQLALNLSIELVHSSGEYVAQYLGVVLLLRILEHFLQQVALVSLAVAVREADVRRLLADSLRARRLYLLHPFFSFRILDWLRDHAERDLLLFLKRSHHVLVVVIDLILIRRHQWSRELSVAIKLIILWCV